MVNSKVLQTAFVALLVACGGEVTDPPGNGGNGGPPSVSLQPDRDNTLFEEPTGALSNGAGDFIFAGRTSTTQLGTIRRGLIRFDIAGSALPAGATIDSVRLRMNMSRTIAGPTTVSLHRVTADWGAAGSDAAGAEGGGAAPETGDATWIHTFFDTDQWTNPGGDFVAGASAGTQVQTTGFYTWASTTMRADVRGWQADAASNFGWILIGDETAETTAKRFDSVDIDNAANRPQLTIFYTRP